jgi:hypothetical protein
LKEEIEIRNEIDGRKINAFNICKARLSGATRRNEKVV